MINVFFGAKLIDYNTINVAVFSSVNKSDETPIVLYDNRGFVENLNIVNQSFLNGLVLYECKSKNKIELGNEYSIGIESFGTAPLNVNDMVFNKDFDDEYFYEGELGAIYSKEKTTFKIWAPLASKVVLMLKTPQNSAKFETFKMDRIEKGVYSITINGDLEYYKYRFQVTNSGTTNIVTDPYAKGSDSNGRNSIVIDLEKTKMEMYSEVPPVYKNYVDTIIYELNVRDFTIDKSINVVNKGKFLGLIEENIKTPNGNPAGFDYLKTLNITHVQLLPILDFKTVDENNPDKTYNWGYDPQQFFALEGSYSTNPDDPYARIIEFKKVVSQFHKNGLRVNLDVVYNHVYNYQLSVLERTVPNYYFRRKRNGLLCNGSGCGNDLASEKNMVRKLIIDSLKYLLTEFQIDGFRFDLAGLIDLNAGKMIVNELKKINKNVMLYGEGWDMPTELTSDNKTSIYNSFKIPEFGFFNDTFRDIVRCRNSGGEKGYLLGNSTYKEGFKFAFLGSSVNFCYNARFENANQSVNYVECHDNCTLFDKIDDFYTNYPIETKLRMINYINGVIAISIGVPFYHAGQEIGLTKFHEDNTYNKGDKYNMFDWKILDERFDNYLYFKSLLDFRRNYFNRKLYHSNIIQNCFEFSDIDGTLAIKFNYEKNDYKESYLILINNSNDNKYVSLEDYYNVLVGKAGELINSDIYVQNLCVDSYSLNVLIKKRD